MILTVAEGGTMALTQQLSHFNELGSSPRNNDSQVNPFGSPNRPSQTTLFQVIIISIFFFFLIYF